MLVALPFMTQCAGVSEAPAESSEAAKQFKAPDDRGVVYLCRGSKALGAATSTQIRGDGMDAGGTGPGTFFRWELKPGKHTFFAFTTESSKTVELNVEAGNLYFIEQIEHLARQEAESGWRLEMNPRANRL